jgi:hypothetical protein
MSLMSWSSRQIPYALLCIVYSQALLMSIWFTVDVSPAISESMTHRGRHSLILKGILYDVNKQMPKVNVDSKVESLDE